MYIQNYTYIYSIYYVNMFLTHIILTRLMITSYKLCILPQAGEDAAGHVELQEACGPQHGRTRGPEEVERQVVDRKVPGETEQGH